MPIVSSVIVEDSSQRDGRRSVRERHTDHLGGVYEAVYLAEAGDVVVNNLPGRAAQIAADLAATELDADEQRALDQGAPTFVWTTAAAFRARVRQRFQTATGWEAVRLGKFISGLGLSDAQLAALFGVANPSAGLTAVKNRLAGLAARYDAVIVDQGL